MKTAQRILITLAVIAVTISAAVASAQQKGQRGRGGGFGGFGGNSLATLAGNEAVQKDLGISGDLASKLAALRDDMNAARQKEYQSAGINPQDFQNMSNETRQKMTQIGTKLNEEFDPKLKAILSADQVKRLNQIRLQSGLANQGPMAILAPDVASELNLTDEQKQKLNTLNAELGQRQRELFNGGFDPAAAAKLRDERIAKTTDLLTAEQKEKLNTLKGSAFDVGQLTTGFGGRRGKGN